MTPPTIKCSCCGQDEFDILRRVKLKDEAVMEGNERPYVEFRWVYRCVNCGAEISP